MIIKTETITIDEFQIIVNYHTSESELLLEAKHKGTPLVGTYSFTKHPPHTQPGEYHLHVYDGNNQIFAINKDGTGHDGYHGYVIPNKVYQTITQRFPSWLFPPDQIIEALNYTYILNPISTLRYSEIVNEIEAISKELRVYEQAEKMLLLESNLPKAQEQIEVMKNRFKGLYKALSQKIEKQ